MRLLFSTHIRTTIASIFILLISITAGAQNATREKVESMRIAFITERLNLTPAESKQFWPVYNSYRHDLAQLRRNFYPHDDGTDPHLDADRQIEFEQKRLDLRKNYMPEFEQAVGKAKLNKLIGAEEDFRRLLMQTMRNRQQRRGWR